MRRNGYLCTSGVNLDTAVRFADPAFLFECKISAIWRRFTLIFAFNILNVRHISISGWFDLLSRKYTTRVDTHVDNFRKVLSWYDRTLPSYSAFVCWYITWHCDLDFRLFDLEQLLYMAGNVTNLSTKFEDPTHIRSWFMSYNVFRRLPLKMRMLLLRMRRITWPASRGSKTITFLESLTTICLFGGSTLRHAENIWKRTHSAADWSSFKSLRNQYHKLILSSKKE